MLYISPSITAINSPFLNKHNTGLGNVLFQIASCYGLSKITNRKPLFNNVYIFANKLNELFGFPHKKTILRNCLISNNDKFEKIHEKNGMNRSFDDSLIEKICNSKSNIEIYGYLEHVNYFHQYKQEIIDLFSPDIESLEFIKLTQPILFDESVTTVSIHFRGNELYNTLFWDYSFYTRAIKYISERYNNCIFLIFSDDFQKINYSFLDGYKFHNICNQYDYLDIWCMSLCNHNIISHSTFSFWGAYLNSHTDALILYNNNLKTLYLPMFTPI